VLCTAAKNEILEGMGGALAKCKKGGKIDLLSVGTSKGVAKSGRQKKRGFFPHKGESHTKVVDGKDRFRRAEEKGVGHDSHFICKGGKT